MLFQIYKNNKIVDRICLCINKESWLAHKKLYIYKYNNKIKRPDLKLTYLSQPFLCPSSNKIKFDGITVRADKVFLVEENNHYSEFKKNQESKSNDYDKWSEFLNYEKESLYFMENKYIFENKNQDPNYVFTNSTNPPALVHSATDASYPQHFVKNNSTITDYLYKKIIRR